MAAPRVLLHAPPELTAGRLKRLGEGIGKVVYASEHWVIKRPRTPSEIVALILLWKILPRPLLGPPNPPPHPPIPPTATPPRLPPSRHAHRARQRVAQRPRQGGVAYLQHARPPRRTSGPPAPGRHTVSPRSHHLSTHGGTRWRFPGLPHRTRSHRARRKHAPRSPFETA